MSIKGSTCVTWHVFDGWRLKRANSRSMIASRVSLSPLTAHNIGNCGCCKMLCKYRFTTTGYSKSTAGFRKERPWTHLQMSRRQSRRYQTYNFLVLQMALNDDAEQRLQILSLDVFSNLDQRSLIEWLDILHDLLTKLTKPFDDDFDWSWQIIAVAQLSNKVLHATFH